MTDTGRPSRGLGFMLWMLGLTLALGSMIYQKRTGPTYPLKGSVEVGAESTLDYELIRSEETVRDAAVIVPRVAGISGGTLFWRRYPTEEPFREVPFAEAVDKDGRKVTDDGVQLLSAHLPRQSAAGKVEYWLRLDTSPGQVRVPVSDPNTGEKTVVLRYKDPVPQMFLVPHVSFMILSIILGIRAGLSALLQPHTMRRYAWAALVSMSLGGMVFGPIVQKYAFGAYWTGFPWGYDLTDNKMLIMWLAWIMAAMAVGFRPRQRESAVRGMVVTATLVMIVVYLIPHSMRGSELDYEKLDQGTDPIEAIGTSED